MLDQCLNLRRIYELKYENYKLRCDPVPMVLVGPLGFGSLRRRSGLDDGRATHARRRTGEAIVFHDLDMGVVNVPNLAEQCLRVGCPCEAKGILRKMGPVKSVENGHKKNQRDCS